MHDPTRTPRSAAVRGRGAASNPAGRFERYDVELDADARTDLQPETILLRDATRSVLSRNSSPDVGANVTFNPYRGCEHGCSYCFARPTHEFLGLSAGLDFETRILVKRDAALMLREAFASPSWTPETVLMSGVTDAYQPIERKLGITRAALEVFAEFRNPITIITKNHLVTRDLDLLIELARYDACVVVLSITSLDHRLQRELEPRASTPERRLDAVRALSEAGVPVGVNLAPVIPGLTDTEIAAILGAASDAGASFAGYQTLRLPFGVKEVFEEWLRERFPDRADRVLNRVRSLHAGRLYDGRFGIRSRGRGPYADQIAQLFKVARMRSGLDGPAPALSAAAFHAPSPEHSRAKGGQLDLF